MASRKPLSSSMTKIVAGALASDRSACDAARSCWMALDSFCGFNRLGEPDGAGRINLAHASPPDISSQVNDGNLRAESGSQRCHRLGAVHAARQDKVGD